MIIFSFLSFLGCPKNNLSSPPLPEEIFALHEKNTVLNPVILQNQYSLVEMSIPKMQFKAQLEAWFIKDEGSYIITEIPNIGKQESGYHKAQDIVWSINPLEGDDILSGFAKKNQIMLFENVFLPLKEQYREPEYIGMETVNDISVHKVKAKDRMDNLVYLYFDDETFYLRQTESTLIINGGEILSNAYFTDFITIEGNIFAQKTTLNVMNIDQEISLITLKNNLQETPKIAIPSQIQELLEERIAPPVEPKPEETKPEETPPEQNPSSPE